MKLTKNFDSREFACRCCGVENIDPLLVANLQVLRDEAGVPLAINSGYRCEKHNKEVGGSSKSQHVLGKAADVRPLGDIPLEKLCRMAEKVPGFSNGGIGYYPHSGFIHVDVRGTPARWTQSKTGKLLSGLRY